MCEKKKTQSNDRRKAVKLVESISKFEEYEREQRKKDKTIETIKNDLVNMNKKIE